MAQFLKAFPRRGVSKARLARRSVALTKALARRGIVVDHAEDVSDVGRAVFGLDDWCLLQDRPAEER